MSPRAPVTFLPRDVTVWVEPGVTLLEAARMAGVAISATCGGRGVCGTCGVKVVAGRLADPSAEESALLSRAPTGTRLSCRSVVEGPVTAKVLTQAAAGATTTYDALPTGPLSSPLVAGVDLGTTYVTAAVLECDTAREVGRASVANAQQSFGADVVSRIAAALEGHAATLSRLACESVVEALRLAAGAHMASLETVVIAANSAMAALLIEVDVSGLAHAPFTAPRVEGADVRSLSAAIGDSVRVKVVPPIAAFVGGDVLAGLVGVGAPSDVDRGLLVDIGTNAEVALWSEGRLTVASAPAGPAFEGVGVTSGGPAVPGAVVRIELQGDAPLLRTMGDAEPKWFSGSGLLSAVAMLRRAGHLTKDGLLVEEGPLGRRFSRDATGILRVDLGDGAPLYVSQTDVRAIQLAKAAARVAIEGVIEAGGTDAHRLDRIWVAGAFGAALDADDLVSLGVVPSAWSDRLEFPGNTSLAGAVMLALDAGEPNDALSFARHVCSVELPAGERFTQDLMRAVELQPFGI